MRRTLLSSLALASLLLASTLHASPYAASVVSYNPGSGCPVGYTNASAALGQPSTADSYGIPIDPFYGAWETNQLVSIGTGGWLTVKFDRPIVHYPQGNRDFIIYGNSFFDVTNYGDSQDLWSTEGMVFDDAGQSRVSVSSDGVTFFTLNPALAPTASYLYPTDAAGNFQVPVNPALTANDFAGLTMADIRLLYNGSAGGASYDTAWAQDTNGDPVCLPEIRYVRIDVTANHLQIAGLAAVAGTVLAENFSNCPAGNGWQTFGDTNLFTWDATNQDLEVTWDSSQPNSYFYHPLGTVMTTNDAFSLTFDLQLADAGLGTDGGFSQFELAIGFLNLAEAQQTNFLRGTGHNATNVAEFDYFLGNGGSAVSLDATLIDGKGHYYFPYANVPLATGALYHVMIQHAAGAAALTGQILLNGQVYASMPQIPADVFSNQPMNDIRLDTIAVIGYSDAGSHSSLLAHGTVQNLFITAPPPPVTYLLGCMTNQDWQAQFWSRSNWNYTLEKSTDLQTWSPLGPATCGNGGQLTLQDTHCAGHAQFYRVSTSPQ